MYLKNKNLLVCLLLLTSLTGCEKSVKTSNYQDALLQHPDFKDCKANYVGDGWTSITIVRCPLSTTTVTKKENKTTKTTVVIDGVMYESKEE